MAQFTAETVVEALEYTLLPYVDSKGVIPEPSTLQVQAFMNAQATERERLRKELAGLPDDEPLEATLKRLGSKQVEAAVKRNAQMYAALCSGTPSAEELAALPHRIFAAFAAWVSEQILNPEAVSGAGRTAGQTQPSAAAA